MFQYIQRQIQGHLSERGMRHSRLVTKDGRCNIEFGNIRYPHHIAFLMDFWTTFVEIRWRFVLCYFAFAFTGSWFIFGLLWYSIAKSNGDLLGQNSTSGHVRCIENVNGLTTAFLYSLETQTTIGYGGRALTGHCVGTIFLIIIQSLIGAIINCFMCGLILAKISLPKKRAKTVTFSDTAVICLWKGSLCLLIRVANLRKTLLIGSHVYGKLLRTSNNTAEGGGGGGGGGGGTVILDQTSVDFTVDAAGQKDNLFFICPLTLYHVIDKSSPFCDMSADSLHKEEFELVVFLDGTTESTSSSCQVRTSYVPREIQWGHSFLPIVSKTGGGRFRVDFANFSKTIAVPTPQCLYCFQSNVSHDHCCQLQTKQGIDNCGFEVVDMDEASMVIIQGNAVRDVIA